MINVNHNFGLTNSPKNLKRLVKRYNNNNIKTYKAEIIKRLKTFNNHIISHDLNKYALYKMNVYSH